jgi:hypothetical protein
MSDTNLQLVREFFELNLFRVLTNWQQDSWRQQVASDPRLQVFVENTAPPSGAQPDFLLHPHMVGAIERAVVEVRAWHGDRFYPSLIESSPVLSDFVQDDALAFARLVFENRPFQTILIVSELPAGIEQRNRSLQLLQNSGIGHVMEFPGILQDLIDKVSINGNYTASQTLQTLRLLKRYKLIRNQQMEFAFRPEVSLEATVPPTQAPLLPEEESE